MYRFNLQTRLTTIVKCSPCALLLLVASSMTFVPTVSAQFDQIESLNEMQTIQSVSLRSMVRAIDEQKTDTTKSTIRQLFSNFSRIHGFIVDTAAQDVLLIATQSPNWPTLHIDDFIVGHRNVFTGDKSPYCSLDPDPSDLSKMSQILKDAKGIGISDVAISSEWAYRKLKKEWGNQNVVIEGIPKDSRFASKMVDTDYHMKKVSLGLIGLEFISSYIDRIAFSGIEKFVQTGKSDYPISVTRFWFHIELPPEEGGTAKYRFPTFTEAEGIVLIDQCPIVLLTEQQLLFAKSKMGDRRSSDLPAQEFADEFTEHFTEVAMIHNEYAELDNYFRLIAILRAMKFRECYTQAGWKNFPAFLDYRFTEAVTASDTITGLVNFRKSQTMVKRNQQDYEIVVCPVVCGGVDMNFPVTNSQFTTNRKEDLLALKKLVLAARKPDSVAVWNVTAPDSLLR